MYMGRLHKRVSMTTLVIDFPEQPSRPRLIAADSPTAISLHSVVLGMQLEFVPHILICAGVILALLLWWVCSRD